MLAVGPSTEPHAGPGKVRIRVRTAGVSPVDIALRAGESPSRENLALPHVPGVDAAGVIDEVGAGVDGFTVGDEVFGAVDVARSGGASASFAVLAFWAAKPISMSWAEAGAAGTSIETATRALDLLGAGEGRVIGTARPESHAFLTGLGATPLTYGPGLAARVRALGIPRVDLALDVAGAGSLDELIATTGRTAAVITLADFTGPGRGVRLSLGRYGGEPDGRHGLALAAALSSHGRFRVPVQEVFPAARAAEAHAAAAEGPRQGKIVLDLSGMPADG